MSQSSITTTTRENSLLGTNGIVNWLANDLGDRFNPKLNDTRLKKMVLGSSALQGTDQG